MLIDQGVDPRQAKAEKIEEQRVEAKRAETTFDDALREYVKLKRRIKDNLPLKDRTKQDYLGMLVESKEADGKTTSQAGILQPLANKSLYGITADDIRSVHAGALKRGERQAAYAMQVLRAVFNWYGVKVPDNPLSREAAGRDRIAIPQSKATGKPIPPERIGAWWLALDKAANPVSRDYFRFLVLTGARVSEPKKVLVSDCDLVAGRVTLRDTKNRSDHVILLSRQAAEIVERNVRGKKPDQPLFVLTDGKKTIATIIERSGATFRAKDLRSTFASIAEELVTAYTLKVMMNHANGGDVTGTNYVRKGETALRAGWQAVADFIEEKAKEDAKTADVADINTERKKRSRKSNAAA